MKELSLFTLSLSLHLSLFPPLLCPLISLLPLLLSLSLSLFPSLLRPLISLLPLLLSLSLFVDLFAIPDFAAGAMENWGLITYRETALLYDAETNPATSQQRVAVVIAHELAHQVRTI